MSFPDCRKWRSAEERTGFRPHDRTKTPELRWLWLKKLRRIKDHRVFLQIWGEKKRIGGLLS